MPLIRSEALALALGLCFAAPAFAQDLDDAARRLLQDPGATPLLAACPADIWQTRAGWLEFLLPSSGWKTGACADDPAACATACLERNHGEACISLGILMEADPLPENDLAARRAHALACALGQAGGCTNRGGGIRNVPLAGDALSERPFHEIEDCLARTFTIACTAEDSWGCTMAGQAREYGEGVPKDAKAARALYAMACTLAGDPAFGACTFARNRLKAMDAP